MDAVRGGSDGEPLPGEAQLITGLVPLRMDLEFLWWVFEGPPLPPCPAWPMWAEEALPELGAPAVSAWMAVREAQSRNSSSEQQRSLLCRCERPCGGSQAPCLHRVCRHVCCFLAEGKVLSD